MQLLNHDVFHTDRYGLISLDSQIINHLYLKHTFLNQCVVTPQRLSNGIKLTEDQRKRGDEDPDVFRVTSSPASFYRLNLPSVLIQRDLGSVYNTGTIWESGSIPDLSAALGGNVLLLLEWIEQVGVRFNVSVGGREAFSC